MARSARVSGGGGNAEFVVAVRTFDFGEEYEGDAGLVPARATGYDLDATCTGQGQGPSCAVPPWGRPVNDGPGGRDNAVGVLIADITRRIVDFGSASYNRQIAAGRVSLLFRISGYNGTADDDQVTVSAYSPAPLDAFGGRSLPLWDGTDVWPIASTSVTNSDPNKPRFVDQNGYVRGGLLVASLARGTFPMSSGIARNVVIEIDISLVGVFVTGKLVSNNGEWGLEDGQIAGRWPVQDLVAQLSQFPDPLDASLTLPLCTRSLSYPLFRDIVCKFVDIHTQFASPATPCDALSIGVAFTASPARLGNVFELQPRTPGCPADSDPANDSCGAPLPGPDAGAGASAGSAGTGGSGGLDAG